MRRSGNGHRSLRTVRIHTYFGAYLSKILDTAHTRRQAHKHFWEWYAAVQIFEREGACSLVAKCDCANHPVKTERLAGVLSERQVAFVKSIYCGYHTQIPDLFCYVPGAGRFWFAEAKARPTASDRIRSPATRRFGGSSAYRLS